MRVDYAARGGRVTKWKGRIVSIAPGVLAIAVGMHSPVAQAQTFDLTTSLAGESSPLTSLSGASMSLVNQLGQGGLEAVVTSGTVSNSIATTTYAASTGVNQNRVLASVSSNLAESISNLGGNAATGAGSNFGIAALMQNIGNDAFAAITGTSITNSADIGTTNSLSLSGNTMAASVSLSSGDFSIAGNIGVGFNNTDAGKMAVNNTSNGVTAGLVLSSTQVASDVQNATAGVGSNTNFANIAASTLNLTITDASANGNTSSSIAAANNTLAASFSGNDVTNRIEVGSGGAPLLASAAGISSLQTADQVGTSSLTSAAVTGASGINVAVAGAVTGSTIGVTSNSITATASENRAVNSLDVKPGVSVDGTSSYANLSTDLAASGTTVGAADLFTSNVQKVTSSTVKTVVDATSGVSLAAAGDLSGATINTTANTIASTTNGNDGVNVIQVGDATSLSAIVSATNVQSFGATGSQSIAWAGVNSPQLTVTAGTADGSDINNTSLSLSLNNVLASTAANRSLQQVSLSGNQIDAGQTNGQSVASTTTLTSAGTVELASGVSIGNLQMTTGNSTLPAPVAEASIVGAGSVQLTAGNTTGELSTSTIGVNGNKLSAAAVANNATQLLSIEATTLGSSVALASQQLLSGGLYAYNGGNDVVLESTGLSASNLTLGVDGNVIAAGVTGNLAENVASISANLLTTMNTATVNAAMADRIVLTSLTDSLTSTAAVSLLNNQSSAPSTDATLFQSYSRNNSVSNTLTVAGAGTTSGVDLSADRNQVTSMARANTAINDLSLDLGSVDMSQSVYVTSATPGGTNLAALGSAQVNSSAVTSTVDASTGGAANITASLLSGTGAVDAASVSASGNRLTSLASGNSATNNFSLSATNLVTTDATVGSPKLALTSGVVLGNTALAVANEQSNSGAISSGVAAGTQGGDQLITASILGSRPVSDSKVSADDNFALAQAVAASGSTTTATINATTLATSALVGSVQSNAATGDLVATVGNSDYMLSVLAGLGSAGSAGATSLSASRNVIGATSTALTDTVTLGLGDRNTALIAGTGLQSPSAGSTFGGMVALIAAEAGVPEAQAAAVTAANELAGANAAVATAEREYAELDALASDLEAFALTATDDPDTTEVDEEFEAQISALAARNDAGNALALLNSVTETQTAASTANADAQNALVAAQQTLDNADTKVNVVADFGIGQRQTNAGDATALTQKVSIETLAGTFTNGSIASDGNFVLAEARGVRGDTNLSATAATLAAAGDDTSNPVFAVAVSQLNRGAIAGTLSSTEVTMKAGSLGSTDTSESLSMARNTLLASASGVSGLNTLSTSATASAAGELAIGSVSAAPGAVAADRMLVSNQINAGGVTATNSNGSLSMTSASTNGATLAMTGNSILANASGIEGGNLLSNSAGTANTASSALSARQDSSGSVSATATGATVSMTAGAAAGSLLSVTSNTLRAQATNVSSENVALVQGGSISDSTTALTNDQKVAANTSSTLTSPVVVLSGAAVTGTVSVAGNLAVAASTAASARNVLSVTSSTLVNAGAAGSQSLANNADAVLTSGGTQVAELLNRQATGGTVSSEITNTGATSPVSASTSGAMTGSLSVESNRLVAQSRGNFAENALSLTAGSSIEGDTQAVLASNQNRAEGNISASVMGTATDGARPLVGATVASLSGNLAVNNNLIRATGSANTAINTMNVSAAAYSVGAANEAAGITAAPAVSTNANFAVLNGQQNASGVSATVSNYELGAKSTGAVNGAVSLNGNMVMADATGNSSFTTLRLAAAGAGAVSPTGLVSNQINSGNMTASISGVTFTASGAGATTGATSVSGNTVAASSTGNLSSTSVAAQGSVFTNY